MGSRPSFSINQIEPVEPHRVILRVPLEDIADELLLVRRQDRVVELGLIADWVEERRREPSLLDRSALARLVRGRLRATAKPSSPRAASTRAAPRRCGTADSANT